MVIDYGNPPRTISLTSIERRPVDVNFNVNFMVLFLTSDGPLSTTWMQVDLLSAQVQ